MTTPDPGRGPPTDDVPRLGRRQSVSRVFNRIRMVLKRRRPSKEPESTVSPAPAAISSPAVIAEAANQPQPELPLAAATIIAADLDLAHHSIGPELLEVDDAPREGSSGPSALLYIRGVANRERARTLFAKYGLKVEEFEWPVALESEVSQLRVEKPIRMRVRYECHSCSTTFGPSRICQRCDHVRCKQCPRFPPKKGKGRSEREKGDKGKGKEAAQQPLTESKPQSTRVIEMPAIVRSNQDPQPMVQQLQRTCHKCHTPFAPVSAQVCSSCGHLRCSKCARELVNPASRPKDTVPIDPGSGEEVGSRKQRVYRKPRQRLRWYCHDCSTVFVEGTRVCRECLHNRCDQCTRIPKKKIKQEQPVDPAVLQAVQDRLDGRIPGSSAVEPPEAATNLA